MVLNLISTFGDMPLIFFLFYVQFDHTHPFEGCKTDTPMSKYFHKTGFRYHEMHHLVRLDIRLKGRLGYVT